MAAGAQELITIILTIKQSGDRLSWNSEDPARGHRTWGLVTVLFYLQPSSPPPHYTESCTHCHTVQPPEFAKRNRYLNMMFPSSHKKVWTASPRKCFIGVKLLWTRWEKEAHLEHFFEPYTLHVFNSSQYTYSTSQLCPARCSGKRQPAFT